MTTPAPERHQVDAPILEQAALGGDYYRLVLEAPAVARAARAGQFGLLGTRPSREPLVNPFLLRPFSFLRRDKDAGTVEVFYRVVGRGTALLAALRPGDRLTLVAPLGRPWPAPGTAEVLLVAGGVGMPPVLDLAEALAGAGPAVHAFYGGRSRDHIHLVNRFEAAGCEVHLATDDGSLGEQGTNVAGLDRWLADRPDAEATVYACGPEGMLAAAAAVARARSVPCLVSVEAPMACGIGVCRGCAVPLAAGGYKMVCADGPVFPAEEIYG